MSFKLDAVDQVKSGHHVLNRTLIIAHYYWPEVCGGAWQHDKREDASICQIVLTERTYTPVCSFRSFKLDGKLLLRQSLVHFKSDMHFTTFLKKIIIQALRTTFNNGNIIYDVLLWLIPVTDTLQFHCLHAVLLWMIPVTHTLQFHCLLNSSFICELSSNGMIKIYSIHKQSNIFFIANRPTVNVILVHMWINYIIVHRSLLENRVL